MVGVVNILWDGHVLLILRADGRWAVPGGKAEDNETPDQCAAREVYEEVGVRVQDLHWEATHTISGDRKLQAFSTVLDEMPKIHLEKGFMGYVWTRQPQDFDPLPGVVDNAVLLDSRKTCV